MIWKSEFKQNTEFLSGLGFGKREEGKRTEIPIWRKQRIKLELQLEEKRQLKKKKKGYKIEDKGKRRN